MNSAAATDGARRRDPAGRRSNQLRDIELTMGYVPHAEGSALVRWGGTTVLATVTIDAKLPPHLRNSGHKGGWLTAEYALLPRSTTARSPRERLYAGGRTQEIQRLIGRALAEHCRPRNVGARPHYRRRRADSARRHPLRGIVAGYADRISCRQWCSG